MTPSNRQVRSVWNPYRWYLELKHVWHDTRLLVLSAQIAAIYAAILIPFKVGIPLIPGFSELRPANAIPLVASLLFGPAAAWGAGIGNVIGDCFGTLGPASLFGFLGNFFYGYVPYLLWGNMGVLSSRKDPVVQSWQQGLEFVVVCFVASMICAGVIGWGVDWLGFLPFAVLTPAVFFNNMVMGLLLGPPLLLFLYPRVKAWGLRYQDLSVQESPEHHLEQNLSSPEDLVPTAQEHGTADEGPILEIQDLTFRYSQSSRPTLHEVSLSLNPGKSLAVMGRGGSGKTTLCFALNGLIPQFLKGDFSGTVRIHGQETRHHPVWKHADAVGIVFQDFETQLVSTNVEAELRYSLECGMSTEPVGGTERAETKISTILRMVGLAGLERRDPLTLSGGQRQRLVIGSVLVREPRILVMDQPMTDLDPAGRKEFVELLSQLQKNGITLVWAEHESEDLIGVDQVCLLDDGRIGWQGLMSGFLRQPQIARQFGIRPSALAECFEGWDVPSLPITIDEAWCLAESLGLRLDPPPQIRMGPVSTDRGSVSDSLPILLELKNVSYRFAGGVQAITDITVTIRQGEFVAILGQNGSGKSTLSKLLNGLLQPTEGCVYVCDRDTRKAGIEQLSFVVGYVFQNPDHQIFAETVWQEVAFGARNVGCSMEECGRRVQEALGAVGLVGAESRDPFSLTKGERQRVAVASVLASKPQILIFDEPTTGLDAEESRRMMTMIQRLHEAGHTIIVITHAMWIAVEYAHRGILLKDGEVCADGPIRTLFANPELVRSTGLEVPALIQFGQRWGYTLLTVDEVRASLTRG